MSFQGKMNGGQVRALFLAYNAQAGSDVVDMSRNYNTGDKYSNQISNGNQIDLAFAEINAEEGENIFSRDFPDYTNGIQMKLKFARLQALVNATGPVWATIDDQVMNQGEAWPIADLNTLCLSVGTTTYTVTIGVLPTGITLNANGTFTGIATNVGAGSIAFTATDDNGVSQSNIFGWDVNNAIVIAATEMLDTDNDGLEDTFVAETPTGILTEDADSLNIDYDKDGIADNVIPK